MAVNPSDDLSKVLELWVSDDLKIQVIVFFHDNPGMIETVEGLAARMGVTDEALRKGITDHLELGILKQRRAGDRVVLVYNRSREKTIQHALADRIKTEASRRAS